MGDGIGAIGQSDELDVKLTASEMIEISQQQYSEDKQRLEFDQLAQRAISTAVDRPGAENQISQQRSELMGGREGEVGEAKSDIVSDVMRTGTESASEDNKEFESSLEDRVMSLYSDLTDYQVAWKIAQKIPQDLSQILKGS